MQASCSLQSELREILLDWLHLAVSQPIVLSHCSVCVAQDIKAMLT